MFLKFFKKVSHIFNSNDVGLEDNEGLTHKSIH